MPYILPGGTSETASESVPFGSSPDPQESPLELQSKVPLRNVAAAALV